MKKSMLFGFGAIALMLCFAGCGGDGEEPTPEPETDPQPEVSKFAMPEANEAVDLGLSVLWSTCNFGAKNVGQHGGYFAWGDPTGELYSAVGIVHGPNQDDGYTSWTTANYGGINPPSDISGTNLDLVARHWKNGWRIPRYSEMKELKEKCQWELINNYGVLRYRVTGPNGNSIVIPLSGMQGDNFTSDNRFSSGPLHVNSAGFYWTSCTADIKVGRGYYVADNIVTSYAILINSETGLSAFVDHLRAFHMSIRPVHDK